MKLGILDLLQPAFGLDLFLSTLPATGLSSLPSVPGVITGTLPAAVRDFLSFLSVEKLQTFYDDQAIVYTGKVQIADATHDVASSPQYHTPSGNLIEPGDFGFTFRITYPRLGSQSLSSTISGKIASLSGNASTDMSDMLSSLNSFGATSTEDSNAGDDVLPSEFPTKSFRIELLFNTLIFHLPKDSCFPAKLAADGWLERDTNFDDVTIHLPKIAMSITNIGNPDFNNIKVSFDGWGTNSLDDPNDLLSGELISMQPNLCLHASNKVGFGLEKIVLDLSANFTPPEILESNFGIGDDFQGLWIPSVRLFIAPSGLSGMAFDTWGKDLLIDFNQGLSGEIGVELVNNTDRAPLEVEVIFFEGSVRKTPLRVIERNADGSEKSETDENNNTSRYSVVHTLFNADVQMRIRGGKAPYTITVRRDDVAPLSDSGSIVTIPPEATEGDANRPHYPLGATDGRPSVDLLVRVTDAKGKYWDETIDVILNDSSAAAGASTTQVQPAHVETVAVTTSGYSINKAARQGDDDAVFVTTSPINPTRLFSGATEYTRLADDRFRIPIQRNGTHLTISSEFPAATGTPVVFNQNASIKSKVQNPPEYFTFLRTVQYNQNNNGTATRRGTDSSYGYPWTNSVLENLAGLYFNDTTYVQSIRDFLARRNGRHIKVYAYASYESLHDTQHEANMALSQRRLDVFLKVLERIEPGITSSITEQAAMGDAVAFSDSASVSADNDYHVAIAVYDTEAAPAAPVANAEAWRNADVVARNPSPANPTPQATEPERPGAFRRIGAKVHFQRNKLVLAEIWGEFDVKDEVAESGRLIQAAGEGNGSSVDNLNSTVTSSPGASANGNATPENQGVIDFSIKMLYDEAIRKATQVLAVGFDRNNVKDGFVYIGKSTDTTLQALGNTLASVLLFAPLIQSGIQAIQNANTPEQRTAAIAMEAGIAAATILGAFIIKMEKITLFDAELSFSELSPDLWVGNAEKLTDVGILFDYAVDFKLDLDLFGLLQIRTRATGENGQTLLPPRARYKAIGFSFNRDDATNTFVYNPIFDTSKGYELSLGDPGALQVLVAGQDIGNLLRLLSARLSKENPLVFEADLALNVNLGVVSIDHVRIRVKIYNEEDPVRIVPEIIPTQVSVNIPGALIGVGYLDFGNSDSNAPSGSSGGFSGYVDITVVPVKLRIAASVGIKPFDIDGRKGTSFFLGLEVELPAGIPLGGTGLGIFGFLGLFGMHYERKETPQVQGQLPPALKWFYDVGGNVINIQGWQPKPDKWSFGIGVILGTMEGGFVLNLKGMFILELPGPRILILVKASLLFPKPPDVKAAGGQQSVGILAVIDLDFNIGKLTIGLVIEYEIESVLSLRVPVVSQFDMVNPEKWFLDMGSNVNPASATILGIVRGYAYLMIHGDGIPNWPKNGDHILNGFSIAVGIGASVIFGDKDSGLYLEVSASFAAGIAFAPFHFYGEMELRGQLHLWIVSISAWANLTVEGPNPYTYLHGKACGKVSFFFFDIEGCVDIEINDKPPVGPPPDLLTALTLVSRSSALIAGQGVDRPIDGALGKASVRSHTGGIFVTDDTIDGTHPLLVVPIDSIPVINFFASPLVNTLTSDFDVDISPSQYTPDQWVSVSGTNQVQYRLTGITLNDTLLEDTLPRPAKWWKKPAGDDNNNDSGIDLALLCWIPDPTPRALQRSEELTTNITNRWEYICKQIAPATTVFYTFNDKPLGFSNQGWKLYGSIWPDPPGTTRNTIPDTELYVYQAKFPFDATDLLEAWQSIRQSIVLDAKVIGYNDTERIKTGRVLQFPFEALYKNANGKTSKYVNDIPPGANATEQETQAYKAVQNVRQSVIEAIKKFEPENIIVDCGELEKADILLTLFDQFVKPDDIIFRTLDKDFNLINQQTVAAIGFTPIGIFTDLPASWQLGSGPWSVDAKKVWNLISTFNNKKSRSILVHYNGFANMRYIQIVVNRQVRNDEPPALLLCAIETLTQAEWKREQFETTVKTQDQQTLETALAGDKLRPLLKPNTVYNLTIQYEYTQQVEGNPNSIGTATKTFSFKTDNKAPLRIDPWILTCTPQNDMRYHFIDEAVQIFFNDLSIFQLYKAYGITLTAKVKNANGVHPEQNPDDMRLSDDNLNGIPASILTPWLDTAHAVVSTNALRCINDSGVTEEHQVFTVKCPLLKSTEYTVEIEKEGVPPSTLNEYKTPMYKIAFRTSKYQSVNEFANDIKTSYLKTKLLTDVLPVLNEVCSDNEMEAALNQAGLPSVKATVGTEVSLLWTTRETGGTVLTSLTAIIIETSEPAWRSRPYPDIERITTEKGFMEQWIMKPKPEMELLEDASTTAVKSIAHTQGGGKTIFYLKSTAAGSTLKLNMRRHKFTFKIEEYNTPPFYSDVNIINIQLPAVAPWEEQD